MSWYVLSTTLTGFNTSQQTLSDHMIALQTSLDKTKELNDGQLKEARGELSKEIAGLSQTMKEFSTTLSERLLENSNQLASLNGNLAGMDKRLTESITRQQAFEGLVLQRIVYQGPLDSSVSAEGVMQKWNAVGYNGFLFQDTTTQIKRLKEWETLYMPDGAPPLKQ